MAGSPPSVTYTVKVHPLPQGPENWAVFAFRWNDVNVVAVIVSPAPRSE